MSELIRFQPAKPPRRSVPDDRGAQILFFTGVRYQRMSERARARSASLLRRPAAGRKRRKRSHAPPLGDARDCPLAAIRRLRYEPWRDTSPQREAPI
jgi:hypothetical protein